VVRRVFIKKKKHHSSYRVREEEEPDIYTKSNKDILRQKLQEQKRHYAMVDLFGNDY
jgi:hypothetical protein